MVRAGTLEEIDHESGYWVYVDVGFSAKPTCSVVTGTGNPVAMSFGELSTKLASLVSAHQGTLKLVIEAPLSVAFDAAGDPVGRAREKYQGQVRYWYAGSGALATLAAMHLLSRPSDVAPKHDVILFEGFVSFKRSQRTHTDDAVLLREAVKNFERDPSRVVAPENLKQHPSHKLIGLSEAGTLYTGIPPGITVFG